MHQQGWFSCRSKARFDTEHEAERRARRYGQRVYECGRCGGWHCSAEAFVPRRFVAARVHPNVELDRARKGLAELERKHITGPLRDAAEQRVRELEGQARGGERR